MSASTGLKSYLVLEHALSCCLLVGLSSGAHAQATPQPAPPFLERAYGYCDGVADTSNQGTPSKKSLLAERKQISSSWSRYQASTRDQAAANKFYEELNQQQQKISVIKGENLCSNLVIEAINTEFSKEPKNRILRPKPIGTATQNQAATKDTNQSSLEALVPYAVGLNLVLLVVTLLSLVWLWKDTNQNTDEIKEKIKELKSATKTQTGIKTDFLPDTTKEPQYLKNIESSINKLLLQLENLDSSKQAPAGYPPMKIDRDWQDVNPPLISGGDSSVSANQSLERYTSEYNAILNKCNNSFDRRNAMDAAFKGEKLVSITNARDIGGEVLPELVESGNPTFYCTRDGGSYLVLPIPGRIGLRTTYLTAMYDFNGPGEAIQSVISAARFELQGNKYRQLSKGIIQTE